ncbi:MAG: aminotransferase class V-fold PLP-dependent enzyme [Chromatiales bacterium]|nr:aminotransferase class V-fold PLP-dependent enzyme [Chromatiales bacterium]
MALTGEGADIYRSLGVRPIITASGSTTARGGSKLRPEVKAAMNATAGVMVDMAELNRRAGEVLARHTGAEAGFVSSGSAGGLILQSAAVVARGDPALLARLPDTTGMRNEIIIHKAHRFPYDQCLRATGARFVEIGDGRRCRPWELEAAFGERTAAVAYLFSPFTTRNALPLEHVVEVAHRHDVPVIVNAASYLPPRANLRRFVAAGADMVIFSGGKSVRGPQGTGILVGRRDLIDAAFAAASPHQTFGRGLKVAKEEIVGLVKALEIFVAEDEAAETARYRRMCEHARDALADFDALTPTVVHDQRDYMIPHLLLHFPERWNGPSRDAVFEALAKGDPPVFLHDIGPPNELAVDPFNLDDEELEIVIRRLREVLSKG